MQKTFFLFLFLFIGLIQLRAVDSSPQFILGSDTLVVYKYVPGLTPSDKYTIRVRSAATNNEWVDVFANYTYNRALELPNIPRTDGTWNLPAVQNYSKFTGGWSHAYGSIEMNNGQAVEVEIAAINGFKIGGQDFFKATVHPAQKASLATLVNGKVYFTISNPAQVVIDINGQMDDYNEIINPIGGDVHTISLFANPVIKKPSLNGTNRIYRVEPGTDSTAMRQINMANYDTLYFKPGVHNVCRDFKIYPGKVYYIPGDAMFYGNMNNYGVPQGIYSHSGEDIKIYGYGTISGAKITHEDYVTNPSYTGTYKGIAIENGLNYQLYGVGIVDPANHSVTTTGGTNGKLSWLKIITWRGNGDGIGGYDPAEDCFIRANDDCSYAKGDKKRCTLWKDEGAALFHLATIPENGTSPIIMEDCDVLYARLRTNPGKNGGGFQQRGEGVAGQRNVNVIFRNFRFHDKLINMPVFSLVSDAGSSYKGILFQNISIAGIVPGYNQKILGSATSPWYGGLIFDNITIGGVKVTSDNYKTYFDTNEYVKYLLFGMPQNRILTTVADPAKGSVSRNPDQSTYLETSSVTLSAVGKSGYVFSNWSGDATGNTNPLTVVVDKDRTITANFSKPNFGTPIIMEAPGTDSITIGAGVDSVTVKIWGGGGAGGSASNDAVANESRGSGGAGGSFASVKKKVTEGQVISYTVGAGGIAAPVGFTNLSVDPVQNGGYSQVSLDNQTIAYAQGGPGGKNIANAYGKGTGSSAFQSGNIGDIVFYGGNGATSNNYGTGGGGGSAGASGSGGNAPAPAGGGIFLGGSAGADGGAVGGKGLNATGPGYPGNAPGAGGAGGSVRSSVNTIMKGGAGANGKVILTFKVITGLSTLISDLNNRITIYPNPTTDKMYFKSTDKLIDKIQIVDLTGKIVYSANVQLQNGSVDLSRIAEGMYLVRMYIDTTIVTKKISIKY